MRISDWSSDVCSSDLRLYLYPQHAGGEAGNGCGALSPEGATRIRSRSPDIHADKRSRHCIRTGTAQPQLRSEEHASELQSLMRISYAVFCLKKKKKKQSNQNEKRTQNNKTKYTDQ